MAFILGFILMAFLIKLFTPKPEIPEGENPSLDGFKQPTADKGRVIQEVFGTTLIKSSNCFAASKPNYESIYN